MHLLVLDHHDSFVHNILQLLRESPGVSWDHVQTEEGAPQDLSCYDALILSPGPGVPADYPSTRRLLQRAVAACIPVLGICLGHQTIAQLFGAELYQLPAPLHGHPSQLHDIDRTDAVVGTQPEGAIVGRYHSWAVDTRSLPEELVATSFADDPREGRVVMSLRHRTLPIWGVQFHPESMITSDGKRYLQGFLDTLLR